MKTSDINKEKPDPAREEFYSERIRDEAVIRLKTVSGKIAADIGAGTGFFSEGLINAGLDVIAVDESSAMVEFMTEKFSGIREFRALQNSSAGINLDDESLDYVFANMYLHHAEDPGDAITEIYRILKTGGKTAVTDLLLYEEGLIAEHGNRHNGFTIPDIYIWFIKAGFRDVSVEKLDYIFSVGEGSVIETFICTAEK